MQQLETISRVYGWGCDANAWVSACPKSLASHMPKCLGKTTLETHMMQVTSQSLSSHYPYRTLRLVPDPGQPSDVRKKWSRRSRSTAGCGAECPLRVVIRGNIEESVLLLKTVSTIAMKYNNLIALQFNL